MKKSLALVLMSLMANVAAADRVGVYSDSTGNSCSLASGFSTTATIIHQIGVNGSSGCRFGLRLPVGSVFYAIAGAPHNSVVGTSADDLLVGYSNGCQSGTHVVGTIIATYTAGTLRVVPTSGFASVAVWDCDFIEHAAPGGTAYIDGIGDCDAQPTAVPDSRRPEKFVLHAGVPNPFNPSTVVRYDVPASMGYMTLRIYDARGGLVKTLAAGTPVAGEYSLTWDGRDEAGHLVSSGVYLCNLTANAFSQTRKLVLLK